MQLRRWFLSSFILLVCASALGQGMKLLTPNTGWAVSGAKLFWTADNGSHWKNITPHVDGHIDDVFFLNTSRGWAMLSSSEDNDTVSFRLARTTDSGQSWTSAPFKIPNQEAGELSGTGWLDFVDPEHGWFMLQRNSSTAFSLGRLFGTSDGGTSWHVLDAPVAGCPVFVTAQDGWISGPGWAGIYSTHDGGKSWQGGGPSLEDLPPWLPTQPSYGGVKFIDAKHGFIPIWLQAATDAEEPRGSALALYVTEDGGRTWKRDRTLTDRGAFTKTGAAMSRIGANTVVPDASGSVALLTAFNDRKHLNRVTVMAVASQGEVTTDRALSQSSENVLWRPGDDIAELSFASTTQGWARTSIGDLLSTADGGATWKDISPIPVTRPAVLPTPNPVKFKATPLGPGPKVTRPLGPQGQSLVPASSTVGLHYTERLGFDEHNVATIATMGTWFSSSPFFDVGIYVGGGNYCGKKVSGVCTSRPDPGLSATWVTQAEGEGWGIMPIWIGPQAPCNTNSNYSKISTVQATAQAQGTTEADSAATAMDGYGLSGTVVFYDMEYYSGGSQCSLAVRAFLTGWVNEMNVQGFQTTAVYGNPSTAMSDFSQVPGLTEVWIAATPGPFSPPRVTIWGLGGLSGLSDGSWNDAQRAHQFLQNVGSGKNGYMTYGTKNTGQAIDYDVEDLLIAGGRGTKNYIWTESTINATSQFPNATEVFTPGINDVLPGANAPAFINAGQLGQIVGHWLYVPGGDPPPPCGDAGCNYGFLYGAGNFTSFSDPSGPSWTVPYGINNAGTVAGDYCYGTYVTSEVTFVGECVNWNAPDPGLAPQQNGFLGTPATGQYAIVTPDATTYYTYVTGINDDQQAVGYYWLASNNQVTSFLYQNSSFTLPSISEANCPPEYEGEGLRLEVLGINGYSQMVGICSAVGSGAETAFLFDPTIPATIPISPTGAVDTVVWNINNQGQILGQYTDVNNAGHAFMLDNGTYYALPGSPNSWSPGNAGFNDAAQFVGYSFDCAVCIEVLNPE